MKKPIVPEAYLLDIEGVLVRDKRYEPVPGAPEWLAAIRRLGRPFCLVSNNTTQRPVDLVADLVAAGFAVTSEQLVTALELGVQWLRDRGHRRLLWLGRKQLRDFWHEEGFRTVAQGQVDAVVLGANSELTVAELNAALTPLREGGADLVCLHRNPFFLDGEGLPRLGPGAWAAALETVVAAGSVVTIGKPEPLIYRAALNRLGVAVDKTLFISDDPIADLVTAGRLGMGTALVLSGKYDDTGVLGRLAEADWPDQICASCIDLQPEATV